MSRRVIIGTAGHIDHGKSALVRALTGTDPDRLKEEKERGITIELGFAHLLLPSGTLAGIVDVPGHERFVRTMVAGAAGIDIVLLVIGIDEGIKPQTREHLDICRLLRVRHGIVVLNKRDRVDDEWAQLQEEEVRDFVRGSFLEGAPILSVSALTGQGIPELVGAIDRLAAAIPGKDPSLPFRLPVDRSFTIKGFGTVVTGTVVGGAVRTGEEVAILPSGTSAKVRGIQLHGGTADQVEAGNRAAINLQGVEKENAPRGSVLCRPDAFRPTRCAEVALESLRIASRPLKTRERVTFHAGTASSPARVVLYGRSELPPGGSGIARIEFLEPFVLSGGDRFILRGFTPLANYGYTVGGGTILHPYPPRRKGTNRAVPPVLEALRDGEGPTRVESLLADAGREGISERDLPAAAGLSAETVRKELDRMVGSGRAYRNKQSNGYRFWHQEAVRDAAVPARAALVSLHDRFPERTGFPAEEVAAATAPGFDPALVGWTFPEGSGVLREGDLFSLPERRPRSIELTTPLAESLERAVREAGLAALTRSELADRAAVRGDGLQVEKTLDALVREGRILRIKELHFDPAAVETLKAKLGAWLETHGEIGVPEFKELAGLSRKYVIPLIEYFDQMRFTLRVGEKRILRGKR